jgi:hypothetical protein
MGGIDSSYKRENLWAQQTPIDETDDYDISLGIAHLNGSGGIQLFDFPFGVGFRGQDSTAMACLGYYR